MSIICIAQRPYRDSSENLRLNYHVVSDGEDDADVDVLNAIEAEYRHRQQGQDYDLKFICRGTGSKKLWSVTVIGETSN